MPYFGVCFISDKDVRSLLNLAVMICDPDEKMPTHITVSGPFNNKTHNIDHLENVEGQPVSIIGAGQFRSADQATVYLKCGFPSIKDVWEKKHYGFNPHITLYDGKNFSFSDKLYERLKKIRLFFHFGTTNVKLLKTIKGQKSFDLSYDIDYQYAQKITNLKLTLEKVRYLSEDERINYVLKLLNVLVKKSQPELKKIV